MRLAWFHWGVAALPLVAAATVLPEFSRAPGASCGALVPRPASVAETSQAALRLDARTALHRKDWEFAAVARLVRLEHPERVLVLAAGRERLVSWLAAQNVTVVATDQRAEGARAWVHSNQHSSTREDLYHPDLVSWEQFAAHVTHEELDMTVDPVPEHLRSAFDLVYSLCAVEHVGTLERSKAIPVRFMASLRSGGLALHTTEFTLSSLDSTVMYGDPVIWRRQDVERVLDALIHEGHEVEPPCWDAGPAIVDTPPFSPQREHVHLRLLEHTVTSYALIARRGKTPPATDT